MEIKEVPTPEVPIQILLEADPSVEKIRGYLDRSRCFVATIDGEQVGAYVVRELSPGRYELMSIAVAPEHQRKGNGATLLNHAISTVRDSGAHRLEVGTGTFGYQLAYYQRAGFRAFAVQTNFFLEHYAEPIYEDGIQHQDMLRLAIVFKDAGRST